MSKKITSPQFRELVDFAQVQKNLSKRAATQWLKNLPDYALVTLYAEMQHDKAVILSLRSSLQVPESAVKTEQNPPVLAIPDNSDIHFVVKEKTPPSSKPRKVTYSFKIDPSVLVRLRQLAETEERDVSDLIRLAVNNYLKMKSVI